MHKTFVRLRFILFVFLFGFTCYNSQALPKISSNLTQYPKYEYIITNFFDNYAPEDLISEEYLKFVKMTDGWHVYLLYFNTKTQNLDIKTDFHYWSKQKNIYLKLNLPKASTDKKYESIRQAFLY